MIYPDLSPYRYTESNRIALNVGWLGKAASFTRGSIDSDIRNQLVRLARHPVNMMRGLHYCELCSVESPIRVVVSTELNKPAYLGNGELWVSTRDATFAAPTLIVHYIDSHSYLPPAEFCEAVRASLQPDTRQTCGHDHSDGHHGPSRLA